MTKFLILIACVISLNLHASTSDDVRPVLEYDKDAVSFAGKVGTRYIKFVAEDITFPEGPQKEKFERALSLLEEVLNSEEFKTKVIGYTRRGERSYQKNYIWNDSNNRLSNEDVYELIMNGDEKMRANTPGEMNINAWVKKCSLLQQVTTW